MAAKPPGRSVLPETTQCAERLVGGGVPVVLLLARPVPCGLRRPGTDRGRSRCYERVHVVCLRCQAV